MLKTRVDAQPYAAAGTRHVCSPLVHTRTPTVLSTRWLQVALLLLQLPHMELLERSCLVQPGVLQPSRWCVSCLHHTPHEPTKSQLPPCHVARCDTAGSTCTLLPCRLLLGVELRRAGCRNGHAPSGACLATPELQQSLWRATIYCDCCRLTVVPVRSCR